MAISNKNKKIFDWGSLIFMRTIPKNDKMVFEYNNYSSAKKKLRLYGSSVRDAFIVNKNVNNSAIVKELFRD